MYLSSYPAVRLGTSGYSIYSFKFGCAFVYFAIFCTTLSWNYDIFLPFIDITWSVFDVNLLGLYLFLWGTFAVTGKNNKSNLSFYATSLSAYFCIILSYLFFIEYFYVYSLISYFNPNNELTLSFYLLLPYIIFNVGCLQFLNLYLPLRLVYPSWIISL